MTKLRTAATMQSWLAEQFETMPEEEQRNVSAILTYAAHFHLEFEMLLYAYEKRNKDDFNLIRCLQECRIEWDI
jgi:hypothetical protein